MSALLQQAADVAFAPVLSLTAFVAIMAMALVGLAMRMDDD